MCSIRKDMATMVYKVLRWKFQSDELRSYRPLNCYEKAKCYIEKYSTKVKKTSRFFQESKLKIHSY